jgi:hypothetical protein
MTETAGEPRRATEREIELAKNWVRANNPVTPAGWQPTDEPEYAEALEIIIFANGGRYAPPNPYPGDNAPFWRRLLWALAGGHR